MKRILVFSIVLSLFGCAVASPGTEAYQAYIAENKPLAEQGAIKWSEYYDGLYKKALSSKAPAFALNGISDAIDFARQYEAGEITQEQFYRHRHAIQEGVIEKSRAADERAQAYHRQQAADRPAQVIFVSPPAPQFQPYILPMPRQPVHTHCYAYGNAMDCTTR